MGVPWQVPVLTSCLYLSFVFYVPDLLKVCPVISIGDGSQVCYPRTVSGCL